MDEDAVLRGVLVQIADAMARRILRADGDENRQRADRQTRLTAAQVVEPNQPEAQHAVGIDGIFASADRGDRLVAAPQQSPRIDR